MSRQKATGLEITNDLMRKIKLHINKKVVTNNPCSFASFFVKETSDVLVKSLLFGGVIKKVGFDIGEVVQEGKEPITLRCTITDGVDIKGFDITTKKTTHFVEANKRVSDGSVFTVECVNENVTLKDVSFSFLIIPDAVEKTTELIPFEG